MHTTSLYELRARVLAAYGADDQATQELLVYGENPFVKGEQLPVVELPLKPELHVAAWEQYAAEAVDKSVFEALRSRLPQLQFPIQAGISETPAYRAATRRGIPAPDSIATGLKLNQPEKLQLRLHSTLAGIIPVLVVGDRQDFVTLVQAFTFRNEPKPVPDSMGACIVTGFNNWDRIHQYRKQWEQQNPTTCSERHWTLEFQRITPQKALYQDRFIILSEGSYSNVSASALGLADDVWQQLSLTIRLEHECTHYLTQRLFGSMRNNILDELLADYRGIVAAIGVYRADWFLWFVGLESYPTYREGGRLQNYRGQPPLSAGAFQVLQGLVKGAAANLEQFHSQNADRLKDDMGQLRLFMPLTQMTLEELADASAIARLEKILRDNCPGAGENYQQLSPIDHTKSEPY